MNRKNSNTGTCIAPGKMAYIFTIVSSPLLRMKLTMVGTTAFKGIAEKPTVKCQKRKTKDYRKLLQKKSLPKKVTFKDS